MQLFMAINIILLFFTLFLLGITIVYNRHLIVKPSIVVLGFYHIQIQWAGTLYSEKIYDYLPDPYSFLVVLHGFPIAGIFFSTMIFRRESLSVWTRLQTRELYVKRKTIAILIFVTTLILILYLKSVPLQSTGIYAIFSNSAETAQTREESLKLLDNLFVKYGYTFLRAVFAPLLAVIAFNQIIINLKLSKSLQIMGYSAIIIFTFLSVMLPGDRVSATNILLVIIMSYLYIKGMPLKPHVIISFIILVLLIPIILSILREGKIVSFSLIFEYMKTGIFSRTFIVPMETGLWHAHYAQTVDFFGISGIPKLASLYGLDPVNVPNLIYTKYTSAPIPSGLANTSFVFSYYSLFGLPSLFISLIGVLLLDLIVIVYRNLPSNLLLATVACIFVSCMRFVSSDYTTSLLTGGFILIPLAALFLAKIRIKL